MAYLDRPSEAGYFIFPDLSVRHEGKYRLSFNLYEETKKPDEDADKDLAADSKPSVLAGQHDPEASFDWRMELKSDAFDVFSAKKFPGLAESTPLSRTVAEQGCRVRIRRDVRMRRRGDGKGNGDFDEEEVYERQSRAPTVDDFQRERSRSSSSGSKGDPRQPFDQQHGNLGFGAQYQQQPQFVTPQPPLQSTPYGVSAFRQQQYGHPAPTPPQSYHSGYDRAYPQSAYPSTSPREIHEDPYRRASMAGHPNEQFHHYPAPEQNFNRFQPYHTNLPQSPAPTLPQLQLHLSGKYDNSPPAPLPSVRSIAPALHSPTYERREERAPFYSQHSAPLVPAVIPEPVRDLDSARNGKRSFETTFPSAISREPLYNRMRPSDLHDDVDDDYDDEAALMEQMRMSYKRADGTNQDRALPQISE